MARDAGSFANAAAAAVSRDMASCGESGGEGEGSVEGREVDGENHVAIRRRFAGAVGSRCARRTSTRLA